MPGRDAVAVRDRCLRWIRRASVVVVAMALLASCSSGSDDTAGGEAGQDEPWVDTAPLVERLAEAGIAVLADAGDAEPIRAPSEPASPVQLLEWQVRNLELEAAHGAGIPAAELDAAVEGGTADAVTVTPSALIAGWARSAGTPAADHAAELLGEAVEAPEDALFPHLVLVLFASDLAAAGASLPEPTTEVEPPPPTPAGGGGSTADEGESAAAPALAMHPAAFGAPAALPAQGGPCSAVLDFINGTIARVFDAIGRLRQPEVHTFLGGFVDTVLTAAAQGVVTGVNALIDGAHLVLSTGVRVLLAPIMDIIARVSGVVGTVAMVASFVRPWTVVMSSDPTHGDAPLEGTVTARIDLGGLDEWPSEVADCAQRAGAPLPPLRPSGNPVTWTVGPAELAARGDADDVLGPDGSATSAYHTVVETGDGEEVNRRITATATVQRDDATELRQAFQRLLEESITNLLGQTGGQVVAAWAVPLLQPYVNRAFTALEHLRDATGTRFVWVTYRLPDEDEATTGPTGGPGSTFGSCPGAAALTAATGLAFPEATAEVYPETPATICNYLSDQVVANIMFWDAGITADMVNQAMTQTDEESACTPGIEPWSIAGADAAWRVACPGDPGGIFNVAVGDRMFTVGAPLYDNSVGVAMAGLVLGTT